ncbi:hypothetical protein ACPESV_24585 [Streptomyces umbrinus]|uniref:hypothetical protein n=1 Tax=Streptomyces umbrinus TaxID=67370 RepID=UPI003C2E311F
MTNSPQTDPTESARLNDQILTLEAELATVRGLLRTENQRANDAITRETTAEQAALEAQQEARRLGLMVDEYGQGASALTDKLRRARDMHRETCPLATGAVGAGFSCSMCELLDAPAMAAVPAAVEEQPDTGTQAHPPYHRWYVEALDDVANEWAPGQRFTVRAIAVERYQTLNEHHPTWRDGTPVRRRFVRETTSYTVEIPAAAAQPDKETDRG